MPGANFSFPLYSYVHAWYGHTSPKLDPFPSCPGRTCRIYWESDASNTFTKKQKNKKVFEKSVRKKCSNLGTAMTTNICEGIKFVVFTSANRNRAAPDRINGEILARFFHLVCASKPNVRFKGVTRGTNICRIISCVSLCRVVVRCVFAFCTVVCCLVLCCYVYCEVNCQFGLLYSQSPRWQENSFHLALKPACASVTF